MSDTSATAVVPGEKVLEKASVPAPRQVDWVTLGKAAAGFSLGASVLALVLLGKTDVATYLSVVVGPGMAYLGLHGFTKPSN